MIIGIVANETKDLNLAFAGEISVWFEARGHSLVWDDAAYESDFLVVLGGDGTMLRAAKTAAKFSTPMLGINLGNLGYLTDVDRNEGFIAIEKMLAGHFRQERRMMLNCKGELALNEVFLRGDTSKLTSFQIGVGGKFGPYGHMDTLRADGIIVATPTGSTAYNLSAGGPILKPDSEMMVVTAVCPHTLYTRPWVLSGEDQVCITPLDENVKVFLDGEIKFTIRKGESLEISRSEHNAIVIKTSSTDFFGVLRKKMGNA